MPILTISYNTETRETTLRVDGYKVGPVQYLLFEQELNELIPTVEIKAVIPDSSLDDSDYDWANDRRIEVEKRVEEILACTRRKKGVLSRAGNALTRFLRML